MTSRQVTDSDKIDAVRLDLGRAAGTTGGAGGARMAGPVRSLPVLTVVSS